MPSGYSSREDPGQMKKNKQSMADLKLRRLTELNSRLREDLERERIPVSQAAKRYFTLLSHAEFFLRRLPFVATPVHSDSLSLRGTSYCTETSG
jgi:guanine nucleotide-binding protein subunit gamma